MSQKIQYDPDGKDRKAAELEVVALKLRLEAKEERNALAKECKKVEPSGDKTASKPKEPSPDYGPWTATSLCSLDGKKDAKDPAED